MRIPTAEQQAILDSDARIRVVRAVPGSGKTWLVAELIRQELDKWPTKTSGIAALSFTRVGGEEIRKSVGHELGHPHFVGTIDAFLFRYVLRPFLQRCFPSLAAPRLIPGEWEAEHWSRHSRSLKASVGKGINLVECVFINEENGNAVIAHKPHPTQPIRPLNDSERSQVMDAKKKLWCQSGRLTHSDVAFLATKILEHKTLGALIRAELVRRFPLIIVDELQDTGYFLGKSIRQLLNKPPARGVLVGDPDQAIYEFTGAHPNLFHRFDSIESAVSLPLSNSRRCPISVATAASHLKNSEGRIGTANCNSGLAFLVRYSDMSTDIPRLINSLASARNSAYLKVIARQTATVESLIGKSANPVPKLGCPPITHLHRAVVMFRQNRQVAALANARAAIELVAFQYEGVEDSKLIENSIDPNQWKQLAIDCLLRANAEPDTGSLYDWQTQVGRIIDERLGKFAFSPSFQFTLGKLKPQKRGEDWDNACNVYLPQLGTSATRRPDVPVQTVHGVKGETHDVTIFVCPQPRRDNHCPSTIWWSENEEAKEEKRIAYVAMTRTRGDLVVCVSDACYQRLCQKRPEFVKSFECLTVDQYLGEIVPNNCASMKEECDKNRSVAEPLPLTTVKNEEMIGSMKDEITIHGDLFSTEVQWDAQS